MLRHALLATAAFPALALAQSSFTDARDGRPTDAFATSACGDAAAREVRERNPMATGAQVKDSRPSPTSDTVTGVSGTGNFKDGGGALRSFSFRCSYDLRLGRTTDVTVF
ncbi:MAG: hypothetical protein ABWX83_15410 [Luteibacter sp.]